MKYCSTCGNKITSTEAATAKFCGACGNPFNKAFQPAKATVKPKVSRANEDDELEEDDEWTGELPQLNPEDVTINVVQKMTVAQLRNGQAQIDPR